MRILKAEDYQLVIDRCCLRLVDRKIDATVRQLCLATDEIRLTHCVDGVMQQFHVGSAVFDNAQIQSGEFGHTGDEIFDVQCNCKSGSAGSDPPTANGPQTTMGKTYESTGRKVDDGESPYCGFEIFLCVENGIVDPTRCFVLDLANKEYVEIEMHGSNGQPLLDGDLNYKTVSGDIIICPGDMDIEHNLGAIADLIVADGAMLGPGGAPVPFDSANPDHEITSIVAHSFFCGDDPCKSGTEVTSAGSCLVEGNGEIKSMNQGGFQTWNGSETPGSVEESGSVRYPAGSAGRICYVVRDLSQPIK